MMSFLVALVILCVSQANAQNPVCQEIPPIANQNPPLPILADTFHTRMEVNSRIQNYSADAELYFDYAGRKATSIFKYNNIEIRLVYNYQDDEIYAIEKFANKIDSPVVCNTYKLSTTTELNAYFGYNQKNSTFSVPGTVYEVLHFNNYPQVFNGTSVHRGIPVNRWTSCHSWPAKRAYFTVTFLFTQPDYNIPFLQQQTNQVPLSAYVKGIVYENNVPTPFETQYEFYEYNPASVNPYFQSIFQTPPGVWCKDRKETKKPPKVGRRYVYSEEIVEDASAKEGSVTNLKRIFYDGDAQLVRYETRNQDIEATTFFTRDPLIIIHDYYIGVSYGINKIYGNCSVRAIDNLSFDSNSNFTDSLIEQGIGFAVQIKDPESFLHLDSVYTFTGQRYFKALPVDTYVSKRLDKYGKFKNFTLESIHEYQFLADFAIGLSTFQEVRNVPVSLEINIPQLATKTHYNYYNFIPNFADLSVFDVSMCYPKESITNFVITFNYSQSGLQYNQFSNQFIRQMQEFTYYEMSKFTNETATRFSAPKLSVAQNGLFYVRSAIVNPPPASALYSFVGNYLLITSGFVTLRESTIQSCAEVCSANNANKTARPCLSFDFCSSTRICYLNEKHVTDTSTSTFTSTTCAHYSRTTLNAPPIKSTKQIYDLLSNLVTLGAFGLSLPVQLPSGQLQDVNFKAVGIRNTTQDNAGGGGGGGGGSSEVLKRFDKVYPQSRFSTPKDHTYRGVSVDECAQRCSRDSEFLCESFDYCGVSGECRLSRREPTNQTDIVTDVGCDIFQKDPLYHYNRFPFQTTVGKNDVKIEGVESESACAKKCDTSKIIGCKSFNYCPLNKSCYLSTNHLLEDSSNSAGDLVCTHYSRSYIKDFTYRSTNNISTLSADLIYANSNLEACSTICVTADGFNCKSFDYCPLSRACLLRNSTSTKPATDDVASDICDNYLREYFYLTTNTLNYKKEKNSKDTSKSTLAAVAVIFTLSSVAIGAVLAVFILPKYKPNLF